MGQPWLGVLGAAGRPPRPQSGDSPTRPGNRSHDPPVARPMRSPVELTRDSCGTDTSQWVQSAEGLTAPALRWPDGPESGAGRPGTPGHVGCHLTVMEALQITSRLAANTHPTRTARTAPHHTAPHCTTPHRTAPHRERPPRNVLDAPGGECVGNAAALDWLCSSRKVCRILHQHPSDP